MTAADRAYRWLLRAYPAPFRAEFGTEMQTVFGDRRREMGTRRVAFWTEVLWDVARSAPALRVDAFRAQWRDHNHNQEGTMKTMAILAVLIGLLEIVNSAVEAWVGGVVLHGGASLVGGASGAIAGAVLLASAVALLRRSPGAATRAQGAAIACLAVFAGVALVRPMFSIFASALGIGFPIVLLLFLRVTGRGTPAREVA
jgi:hypothetical protein